MIRQPTLGDAPLKAWNKILLSWSYFKTVPWSLGADFYTDWVRLSDGQCFETPPMNMVYEQLEGV